MSDLGRLFRVDGQVALVTGGGGGIGGAAARLLAEAGARVAVADLDVAAARRGAEAVRAAGGAAAAYRLDVTDEASVARVVEACAAELGPIDILINNAGISIRRPSAELSAADWRAVIDVNLTGAFLCARAVGQSLLAREAPGAIINTASIMSFSGGGLHPNLSYQTSKAGIVNMTRTLAVEWAAHGIRVNAVAPTWVDTPLIAHLKADPIQMAEIDRLTPMRRLAKPEEVGIAMVFLASPAAAMITGHTLAVDGGYLAR